MSNHIPVTIQGITVSGSGQSGTVLTQSQANQILQKLRSMQSSGAVAGGNGPQTIKIQAIQTNPTTGAKQIVSLMTPQQVSNVASSSVNQTFTLSTPTAMTSRASPMKVIKIPASGASNFATSDMPPGVKVVKLSAAPATTTTRTVYSPQVRPFSSLIFQTLKFMTFFRW